jgi:hypothetical protein
LKATNATTTTTTMVMRFFMSAPFLRAGPQARSHRLVDLYLLWHADSMRS